MATDGGCNTNPIFTIRKNIQVITMQPRWKDPMETPEGELLTIVKQIETSVLKGVCKGAICKNMACMDDPSCGAKKKQKKRREKKKR